MGIEKKDEILSKALKIGLKYAKILREIPKVNDIVSSYHSYISIVKNFQEELDEFLKKENVTKDKNPEENLYDVASKVGIQPILLESKLRDYKT